MKPATSSNRPPRRIGRVLVGAREDVVAFVSAILGQRIPGGYQEAIGIVDAAGNLVAGVLYHGLRPGVDIEMTVAGSPKGARRDAMRAILSVAWNMFHVQRITVELARNNKRGRRLAEGMGFKLEGVKRRGYDGKRDAFVYGLLKEDCRL